VAAVAISAVFGVGYVATRRLMPRAAVLAGALYGAALVPTLEALYSYVPNEDPLERRVFREPVRSAAGSTALGIVVALADGALT
jgi:hypothetical protein